MTSADMKEHHKANIANTITGFKTTVHDVVESDGKVAIHAVSVAQPTGYEHEFMAIFHIVDGKISTAKVFNDTETHKTFNAQTLKK